MFVLSRLGLPQKQVAHRLTESFFQAAWTLTALWTQNRSNWSKQAFWVELSGALVTSWNQKRWEPHEFLWFLDYIDQPLYDLYDPIRIHDDSLWVPWCVQWWVQWFKGNATLLPPWHWSCFAPSIASVGDWICLGRSWKVTVVTVEVWSSGMIRPREVFALY